MPGLTLSGLASGLDTGAIVRQLAALESRGLQRLAQQRTAIEAKSGQASAFRSKLSKLSSLAKDLDKISTLARYTTTSSDEDVVKVSASGLADTGTHRISVTRLAAAESGTTAAFADKDTTRFGGGRIDILVGEEVTSIDLVAGRDDTLTDVRNAINNADAGVRASIINDGTGFRLVVSSTKTGADNVFGLSISGAGPGPNNLQSLLSTGFSQLSAGQNAALTIDGLAVSSATNKVTDAIDGVTLDLKAIGSDVDISVERDAQAIGDRLQGFLDAYNDVLQFIDDQKDGSDVSLRAIKNQLQRAFRSDLDSSFAFRALSQVGITTDGAGKATLDRSALEDAIDGDFAGFLEAFRGSDDDKTTSGIGDIFDRVLNGDRRDPVDRTDDLPGILSSGNGLLAQRQNQFASRVRAIEARIESENRRITRFEEGLTRRFAAFETLTARYQTQGDFLSQVSFGLR